MFSLSDLKKNLSNLRNDSWSDKNLWNEAVDWLIQPRDDSLHSLKFHVYGTESINLQADVTDNYTESNIAYQDHIALKPRVYTVTGEVGELTWFKNDEENSIIGAVAQKLQPIVAFLPPVSKQAQSAQDKALKVLDLVDSIDNFATRTINSFTEYDDKTGALTEQQKSYRYLVQLWANRKPINIVTPWTKLSNFIIQNVEFTQPDRTRDKTQVKISLKEFRQVKTKRVAFDKGNYQLRAFEQKAEKTVNGYTTGTELKGMSMKPQQWCPDINNEFNKKPFLS